MKKMVIFLALCFSSLIYASVGPETNAEFTWITKDFFVQGRPTFNKKFREIRKDCRANIAKVICRVKAPATPEDWYNRPCFADGSEYVAQFEEIHDVLSPTFQKLFCSLKKIYIEEEFEATGYGGVVENLGAVIGIRKSVLDTHIEFTRWGSWKEQVMFGGDPVNYDYSKSLPHFQVTSSGNFNDFLFQFMVHEFGHVLDMANNINPDVNCRVVNDQYICDAVPGTWGGMNWIDSITPRPEFDYTYRNELCFYSCKGNYVETEKVPTIYSELTKSSFVNTYASSNMYDDFADHLAYYAMATYAQGKIEIHTGQGEVYDLTSRLYDPELKAKTDYIKSFLSGPINYP